ncbi:MAG: TIGR03084 family protein [Notoacmeibacter sp.]|nr:TIGR03084 family protein [Notoacmeibacter sp.]
MLKEADDFLAECETLHALLAPLAEADFARSTQFKGWTVNDVLMHLHFWNRAADQSLNDPDRFAALMGEVMGGMQAGGLRVLENAKVTERGPALLAAWHGFYRGMAARWRDLDPKIRVKWAGPEMSVRSSITARQMETWAHGQELFDLMGVERVEDDRIGNIVVLGVNTYQWGFKVRGMALPGPMPRLRLIAPSGAIWEFGEAETPDMVEGSAVDFCRVVTQTRNVMDTGLVMHGPVAELWMRNAQCFAGPPETPPATGTRGVKAG